jgi:hypothetical protein
MTKPDNTRFPFTDLRLRKLQSHTKDYDYRDTGSPGLTLRVAPSGKKTFRWTYRDASGKHRVKTLGTFPLGMGLADARKRLDELSVTNAQLMSLSIIQYVRVANCNFQ